MLGGAPWRPEPELAARVLPALPADCPGDRIVSVCRLEGPEESPVQGQHQCCSSRDGSSGSLGVVGRKGSEWSCVHVLALTPRSHLGRAHLSKSGSHQRTDVMLTSSRLQWEVLHPPSDRVLRPVREGWLGGANPRLGWSGTGEGEVDRAQSVAVFWTPHCCGCARKRCMPVGRSVERGKWLRGSVGQRGQGGGSPPGRMGIWPGLWPAPRSGWPGHSCSSPLCQGLPVGSGLASPRAPQSPGPSRGSAKNEEGTEGSQICDSAPKALGAAEQPNGAGRGRGHLPDGTQSRAFSTEPPWADFPHCFGGARLRPATGRTAAISGQGAKGVLYLSQPQAPGQRLRPPPPVDHLDLLHLAPPEPVRSGLGGQSSIVAK